VLDVASDVDGDGGPTAVVGRLPRATGRLTGGELVAGCRVVATVSGLGSRTRGALVEIVTTGGAPVDDGATFEFDVVVIGANVGPSETGGPGRVLAGTLISATGPVTAGETAPMEKRGAKTSVSSSATTDRLAASSAGASVLEVCARPPGSSRLVTGNGGIPEVRASTGNLSTTPDTRSSPVGAWLPVAACAAADPPLPSEPASGRGSPTSFHGSVVDPRAAGGPLLHPVAGSARPAAICRDNTTVDATIAAAQGAALFRRGTTASFSTIYLLVVH